MVKQIFLVEDDLSLIGGLSFAVRKEGYEVVLCQEKIQVKSELFLQHSIFSSSQSFYFIQFLFIHILIFVW